jgi:hypothetical protein
LRLGWHAHLRDGGDAQALQRISNAPLGCVRVLCMMRPAGVNPEALALIVQELRRNADELAAASGCADSAPQHSAPQKRQQQQQQ